MIELLAGGATGLLGSAVGKFFSWLAKRQEMQNRKMEFEHELKLLDRQAEIRHAQQEQENDHEYDLAVEHNDTAIRLQSYEHDSSLGDADQWVVNILRLVRPALTLLLIIASMTALWKTADISSAEVADQILYMTAAAVTWWFGDRSRGIR